MMSKPPDGASRRHDRRVVMRGGTIGLMTVLVDGTWRTLSPRQAFAAGGSIRTLTAGEVVTLEALGEALVPGSRAEGLSLYVDTQLSGPLDECLLVARLLGVAPPYAGFYRAVLRAVDACSIANHGGIAFASLGASRQAAFIGAMHGGTLEGWTGPPAPFAYFVLRNDAVDVRYGTEEGFAELGVPYMPHIEPRRKW